MELCVIIMRQPLHRSIITITLHRAQNDHSGVLKYRVAFLGQEFKNDSVFGDIYTDESKLDYLTTYYNAPRQLD